MRYKRSPAYTPGMVAIANKGFAALDIPDEEIRVLGQELDTLVDWDTNPRLAAMVVRGAPRILDAVRMVNSNTKQGYSGAAARGQQIVVQKMNVSDILKTGAGSSTLSSDAMTTWLRAFGATGASTWSGTATNQNIMTVDSLPNLAHVFLGFIDPIEIPKLNKIQLIKEGDNMVQEVLSWDFRGGFGDYVTPTHELLQPWIIAPLQKYYIACNCQIIGDDKMEPVGFTVKRATDILSALA
jgi:hypothetical protein